jgi:peptidoglycan hydrolase CwlO-like protein
MADKESEFRLPPVKKRTVEWLVKLILPAIAAGALAIGGYAGIKETAPTPSDVREVTKAVQEIKEAMLRMEGKLDGVNNNAARDKAENDRRIEELRKAIDRLESQAVMRRELEEVKERLRALEAARPK